VALVALDQISAAGTHNAVQHLLPTVVSAHKVVKAVYHSVWIPNHLIAALEQAISAEQA
jgi:hypothetical protein